MKHRAVVWRTLAFIPCLLLLAACSQVTFVYDRADWFVARWAANYLDLDQHQRSQLRDEVATYREFHREVRVPEIRSVLTDSIETLEARRFDREQVLSHMNAAQTLLRDMTRDVLPLISEVLAELDSEQRETLRERFDERRKEAEEAYAETDGGNELDARQQRMREQARDLLGKLSDEQKALLDDYVAELPDTAKAQLAWETDRQNRLLALLEENASSTRIRDYLEAWWLELRDQPSDLQKAREQRRALAIDYLVRFLPTLDAEQTRRLITRLESYASDLESLLE